MRSPCSPGPGRGWCVVTGPLREQLADYLALRRALGYRMARPEKLLGQFLDHLERAGDESRITVAAALDWARLPAGGGSNWWAYRLSAVRGFATYLHALDPAHQVPAPELLPQRPRRASPYLYSDADLAALIAATQHIVHAAAASHVRHPARVARGHRHPGRGSDRAGPRRCRPHLRSAHGAVWQVRQDPGTGPAPQQCRRAAPLPAAARPVRARDQHGGVLRLPGRNPAALLQRSP